MVWVRISRIGTCIDRINIIKWGSKGTANIEEIIIWYW
jgi:hypothetical protein